MMEAYSLSNKTIPRFCRLFTRRWYDMIY